MPKPWPRWYRMLEAARAVADGHDGIITSFTFRDELVSRRLIPAEGTDSSPALQIAAGWLVGLLRWHYITRTAAKTTSPTGHKTVRVFVLTSFGERYRPGPKIGTRLKTPARKAVTG